MNQFTPEPESGYDEDMIRLIKSLYPFIKLDLRLAIMATLFSLPLAAIKGYQASLAKDIIDKGLSDKTELNQVLIVVGLLFFLALANYPLRYFHFYWLRYVVDKSTCRLRSRVFQKLQKLPLTYFGKSKQGELLSVVINDTQVLSQGFRSSIDLIREPLYALVLFGVALYRDWQLTLVIIVVAPLFLVIFQKTGRLIRKNVSTVQEAYAGMTHSISEGLAGQKITKAFNLESYISSRFNKAQDHYFHSQLKTTSVEEHAHPLVELVGALAFCGVILFAHYRISSGAITAGDFISFVTALALLMDPIRKFSQANVKLNQARAAGDRVFRILNKEEEPDTGSINIDGFNQGLKINNLTFDYGDGPVLKDFSMEVKKGQKVALVGLSGSGKSTLINLLLRLYPIPKGMISVDGHDINDLGLNNLRDLFGLVSQDIFLFHDTILENLKVGQEFQEDQIKMALNVASATQFVTELPQKYETIIGDRGTRLSGGQAQRITIARAFLRDCPILLFDEATSALDNESEKVVQEALAKLGQSKTVIAVAHRLSTIQNFDHIIVLHEGRKVEEGTHHQLMENKGEYHKLYQLSQR